MNDTSTPKDHSDDQQVKSYEEQKNALRQKLAELDQEKRNLESEFKKLAKVEEANFVKEISQKIIDFSQDGIEIDANRLLEKISNKVNRNNDKPHAKVTKSSAKTKNVNPAKYRNPNEPSQTWTGKGRKPGWVVESLANGNTLNDLLINL